MKTNVFYDIKKVPLADRESFNNTILLLTMVRSEYYYIIGFSRPNETITIGFDFESITEGKITKKLNIDFKSSEEDIILHCDVFKLSDTLNKQVFPAGFFIKDGMLCYEDRLKKDAVVPLSVGLMNEVLVRVRDKISLVIKT